MLEELPTIYKDPYINMNKQDYIVFPVMKPARASARNPWCYQDTVQSSRHQYTKRAKHEEKVRLELLECAEASRFYLDMASKIPTNTISISCSSTEDIKQLMT